MTNPQDSDTSPWPVFPITQHSVVRDLQSTEPPTRRRALASVVATYWKPAYKYCRVRWHLAPEDARDLVQSFFAAMLEKEFFASFDPGKARFRTYFRVCLERFAANESRREGAQKRGGRAEIVDVDFADAERELQHQSTQTPNAEDYFDQEWIRHIFQSSVTKLEEKYERSGRTLNFQIFSQYDLQDDVANQLTYDHLASQHNLKVSDVTNYLAAARRDFRTIVLETIRELTTDDQEFRDEVRALLGVKLP